MPLSNTVKNEAIKAGKAAAFNATHECAGTDPVVLQMLHDQPADTRDNDLMEIAAHWDTGYIAERAVILSCLNALENS